MNEQKIASPGPIDRREFVQLCAGSLALAAGGCGRRRRPKAEASTITVLYPVDEQALSLATDREPKFLVFLPLVTHDAKGKTEGRLAESWEHSADYRTWTIHLRKDVRWHDGVPVTAHDIKFTIELLTRPEVSFALAAGISVTVLDDSTCTITYQRRTGTPPSDWTVYYPKHLLAHLDPKDFANWEFWKHPVGNGPYRYVRTLPKTMMEFKANADYYRGKPKIEHVVLKFGDVSGPGALSELLVGNVDVIPYVNRLDLLKLRADARFRVYNSNNAVHREAIAWNQRNPIFHDPRVRRALTLAINRRELLRVFDMPEWTPTFDVIYTPDQYRRGELPDPLSYDLKLATQLLDETGWRHVDSGGLRVRDGRPFRFTALVVTRTARQVLSEEAATYVQAQLRRVGIEMNIQTMELQTQRQRVMAGKFEAAFYDLHQLRDRAFFGEGSPIAYANPKVNDLLEKAQATMVPDEIDGLYRELWPIFQADLPVTFLGPAVLTTIAHRRVRGLSSPYWIDPVYQMENLWLEDER